MKTRNNYKCCSTFLKPTKLDIQYFYGLFKILRSFEKFGDNPKFEETRISTRKLVIPITLVLHSKNQPNLTYNVFMAYLSLYEVFSALKANQTL